MKLFEQYREAVAREASGMPDGTRATYIEWLSERQVLLLEQLVYALVSPEEVAPDEPEEQDRANPV